MDTDRNMRTLLGPRWKDDLSGRRLETPFRLWKKTRLLCFMTGLHPDSKITRQETMAKTRMLLLMKIEPVNKFVSIVDWFGTNPRPASEEEKQEIKDIHSKQLRMTIKLMDKYGCLVDPTMEDVESVFGKHGTWGRNKTWQIAMALHSMIVT